MQKTKEKEIAEVTPQVEKSDSVPAVVSEKAKKLIQTIETIDRFDVRTFISKIATDEINDIKKIGRRTKNSIQGMVNDNSPQAIMDNQLEKMKEVIADVVGTKFDPNPSLFGKMALYISRKNPIQDFVEKVRSGENVIEQMEQALDDNTLKIQEEIIERTQQRKEYQASIDVLKDYQHILKKTITEFEARAEDMSVEDKDHLIGEIIMPLNKKLTNINNVILVNRQTDNSLKLTIDGNREVIDIADTIKTVTLTALAANSQAAIALYEQGKSINQAKDFNSLTSDLIVQNAEQQSMQLDAIEELLSDPAGGMEALEKANKITLETISKQQGMKSRVNEKLKVAATKLEKMDKELEDAMGTDDIAQPTAKKIGDK